MKSKKQSNCNNGSVEQNNNYLPDPCPGCEDSIPTSCVLYDGPTTECLGIEDPKNLNDIIEGLDAIICLLAEGGDYREYDFACFANQNIQSEQQFVEFISDVICQILGTQVPGNITSISEIIEMINNLATPKFTFPDCAEPLVNLPPDSTLLVVLTALRTALCNHKERLDDIDDEIEDINAQITIINGELITINDTLDDHENRIVILEGRPIGVLTDELVKASPTDTTPGYLMSKIDTAGSNVAVSLINSGSNEKIRLTVNIPTVVDEKVKVWSGDTSGFLEGKITSVNAPGINLVTARDGNVIKTTPTLLFDQITGQILNHINTTTIYKEQFCNLVADCIGVLVPCQPPGELIVTAAGIDFITVQWPTVPGSTTVGYDLEYKIETDTAWTVINVPTTENDYTITGLLPGTAYNVRIRTQCGVNNSNYVTSNPNPVITSCPIPTNLQVSFN